MPLRAIVFDLWGTLLIERRGVFPQRAQMRFEGAAPILARHGIHVRAFAEQPTWLRFGLPRNKEEFRRLSAALQVPQKVR